MKTEYQVIDHGAGEFSVQVFDETGKLIEDKNIVRDVNGWRISGQAYSDPQHATPREAARHYATCVHDARPSNT